MWHSTEWFVPYAGAMCNFRTRDGYEFIETMPGAELKEDWLIVKEDHGADIVEFEYVL